MTSQRTESQDEELIGTRPRAQVEEAFRVLEAASAAPTRQTQLSRGAMTGYLWALGRGDTAPVTGADSDGPPDLALLTAEADASVVQLEDATQRTVPRDFIQGVQSALAWVCGHSDRRP